MFFVQTSFYQPPMAFHALLIGVLVAIGINVTQLGNGYLVARITATTPGITYLSSKIKPVVPVRFQPPNY